MIPSKEFRYRGHFRKPDFNIMTFHKTTSKRAILFMVRDFRGNILVFAMRIYRNDFTLYDGSVPLHQTKRYLQGEPPSP